MFNCTPPKAKRIIALLFYINSLTQNKYGYCFASNGHFKGFSCKTSRTLQRYFKTLQELEFIQRIDTHGKRRIYITEKGVRFCTLYKNDSFLKSSFVARFVAHNKNNKNIIKEYNCNNLDSITNRLSPVAFFDKNVFLTMRFLLQYYLKRLETNDLIIHKPIPCTTGISELNKPIGKTSGLFKFAHQLTPLETAVLETKFKYLKISEQQKIKLKNEIIFSILYGALRISKKTRKKMQIVDGLNIAFDLVYKDKWKSPGNMSVKAVNDCLRSHAPLQCDICRKWGAKKIETKEGIKILCAEHYVESFEKLENDDRLHLLKGIMLQAFQKLTNIKFNWSNFEQVRLRNDHEMAETLDASEYLGYIRALGALESYFNLSRKDIK